MTNYTWRGAHFAKAPDWKVGDRVNPGDIVGIMGNSGDSVGAHLHQDTVVGIWKKLFHLTDIQLVRLSGQPTSAEHKILTASKEQIMFFCDAGLFDHPIEITTPFMDPTYSTRKDHPGVDVVPLDRHETQEHYAVHWNRSKVGRVELVGFAPESYGHFIYISFQA